MKNMHYILIRNVKHVLVSVAEERDSIVLFDKPNFEGDYQVIEDDNSMVKKLAHNKAESVEVTGPSSWKLFSDADFKVHK